MKSCITILILYFFASVSACVKDTCANCDIQYSFNRLARDYFVTHHGPDELEGFDDFEKCVLTEAISSYLDELNHDELRIIDSFYIRNYPFDDLGVNFSFVSTNKQEFYFISLPAIYDYLYGFKYYRDIGGRLELRDSTAYSITKVNSSLLDNFMRTEVFTSNELRNNIELANRLLPSIFPNLLKDEIDVNELSDSISRHSEQTYEYIMNKVNDIVNRDQNLTGGGPHYKIYHVRYIGFLLLDFYTENKTSNTLYLDMYFIPLRFRYAMRYEIEKFKYRKCYEPNS